MELRGFTCTVAEIVNVEQWRAAEILVRKSFKIIENYTI